MKNGGSEEEEGEREEGRGDTQIIKLESEVAKYAKTFTGFI